jgi:hypothetical protein
MVEANLKIIKELKAVLEEVSNNTELKKLFVDCPSSFVRERKLTFQRVVGIILNMPRRSLSIELKSYFELLGDSKPVTKSALSLQRTKLLPIFFQVWNSWLVDCFYNYYGENVLRWKGFILLAVDGSMINLVNRKDVLDFFVTRDNQYTSTPMSLIMQT